MTAMQNKVGKTNFSEQILPLNSHYIHEKLWQRTVNGDEGWVRRQNGYTKDGQTNWSALHKNVLTYWNIIYIIIY